MTMMNRTKHLTLVVGLLTVATLGMGQSKTRLQVCSTSQRQTADTVAQKLDSLGYGPAEVRQAGNAYKVVTKAYDSAAEANLAKPYLKGAGFMDAWAVADSASSEPVSEKTVFGPAEAIPTSLALGAAQIEIDRSLKPAQSKPEISPELRSLDNQSASEEQMLKKIEAFSQAKDADQALGAIDAFTRRFQHSQKLAAVKLKRGYWLVNKADEKSALEQFESVAREHPDKAEAGEAELRCGYLELRMKKPAAQTLKRFEKVAHGKVACTPQVRLDAMMRCAALYHRAKDLDLAEAAYLAISGASSDPEVKAYAQVQLAAITLEKAWNGKASFAQARQLGDDVVAKYPQVNKHTLATAALISVETLAYEKNYAKVMEREAAYIQQFSQSEELQLAYYWFALAHLETGDLASAKAIAQTLVSASFPTQERFKLVDVTTSARKLMKRIEEAEKSR